MRDVAEGFVADLIADAEGAAEEVGLVDPAVVLAGSCGYMDSANSRPKFSRRSRTQHWCSYHVELHYRLGPKAIMHIKPDLRDWLTKRGADPMTLAEFARFVVSERESAAIIINTTDIKC